jgi:hypothetical protein
MFRKTLQRIRVPLTQARYHETDHGTSYDDERDISLVKAVETVGKMVSIFRVVACSLARVSCSRLIS